MKIIITRMIMTSTKNAYWLGLPRNGKDFGAFGVDITIV
jgi:hypothetical protein